ncbi:MAG: hypothetical protein B6U97_03055 [Candidatus Altiarchaeales archaeon ex4484_96]|nr:MAG: hypothetical protein B6U97_03055 [Candidatus Altiarchaeales archaeon ex4484_96]
MSKPLPPTLREKSRYLVVEFICGVQITKKDFGRVLWKTVLQVLGENGVSRLNLWIIDWDHGLGRGIVKVTQFLV